MDITEKNETIISKKDRQRLVKKIITESFVATQEQLIQQIQEKVKLPITQATISRDIRELGIVKITTPAGHHYAIPETSQVTKEILCEKISDVLVSSKGVNNTLIIQVMPGNAQSIAWLLDHLENQGILGTIGGNDTILVIFEDNENRCMFEKYLFSIS